MPTKLGQAMHSHAIQTTRCYFRLTARVEAFCARTLLIYSSTNLHFVLVNLHFIFHTIALYAAYGRRPMLRSKEVTLLTAVPVIQ